MPKSLEKVRKLIADKAAKGEQPTEAEIAACFAEEATENARKDAEAFAREMVAGEHITPASANLAAAVFYQALMDDNDHDVTVTFSVADPDSKEGKDKDVSGSRADLVRAFFASLPKHGLTTERLPSVEQDTATAEDKTADFGGNDARFRLGNGAHRESGRKNEPAPTPANDIYTKRREKTYGSNGR